MRTMRWIAGDRGLGGLVDNIREKRLPKMRCVNCGSIEDSVIHDNRLIERSAICCTTH